MVSLDDSALIGRQQERAVLEELIERARAGRGGLAFIWGEAGIGKSTLVRAVARSAEAKGFQLAVGQAWEFAEAPAYFPLRPALQSIGVAPTSSEEGGLFRLWEQAVAALGRCSAQRPTLWVVEDVHAADQQSVEFLCLLAQPLRALHCAVLVTSREHDARLSPHLAERLVRLRREALDLHIKGLELDDATALAVRHAPAGLSKRALTRLTSLAEGNPLFLMELARVAGAGAAPVALPQTIQQLVLAQLSALPPATRVAVSSASVLGREFAAATVARMHDQLPARVIDDLEPAVKCGLLLEAAPGRFVFRHEVSRGAIYESVGAQQRLEQHGLAERALRTGETSAERLAERAHHALLSVRPGHESEAIQLGTEAVRQSEVQGAYDRAYALAARVREARLAAGLPDDILERLALGRLARAAGLASESRRICDEVIAEARAGDSGELFARAVLLRAADLNPGVVDRHLIALLEEARARVGDGPSPLGCCVDARLAAALQPAADPLGPVEMARRAVADARGLRDEAWLVEVMFYAGSALADYAPVAERVAFNRELLERCLGAGDRPRALHAYGRLLMDEAQAGDFESFEPDADAMLSLAREGAHPRHTWRALMIQAMRALARGAFAEAERTVVEVEKLTGTVDDPSIQHALLAHELMRSRTLARGDLRTETVEKARETLGTVPFARASIDAVFASHLIRLGDTAGARREVAEHLGTIPADPILVGLLAEVVATVGTPEQRRSFLEALRPLDGQELVTGHIPFTYEGPIIRLIGLLQAGLGELGAAEQALRTALALSRRRGHRPWIAIVASELARVLAQAGRRTDAAALESEAQAIASALGMSCLAHGTGPAAGEAAGRARPTLRMRRDNGLWAIDVDERTLRMKDSRGLQLLARLVERPDEEIHVLALASDDDGSRLVEADAGELLDEQAVHAYRERLRKIEQQAAEAGDGPSAEELEREREFLERTLAAGLGLRGARRRAGSLTERARISVQRRVREAIRRLGELDPVLGAYLDKAVRTGTYCSFRP